MAFLRVEKKQSGTYLRIIQSYRADGKTKHKTLHSLGKLEDYSPDQIERIAQKLMALVGRDLTELVGGDLKELARYNYGYALVIQKLWTFFNFPSLVSRITRSRKLQFDWSNILQFLLAERLNDPCSKLSSYAHQNEYIGLSNEAIELHHIYRTLDVLSSEEDRIKKHLFNQRRSLFTSVLDVVFYDVTTLYFDSSVEQEKALRQKGYSKDGKAHKTQVVLGLLVDKDRNPISYQVYQGNTYEGGTMIDALKKMKAKFSIDQVVVVADSAMIDQANRDFMNENGIDYIVGDSIKSLGKTVQSKLIDKANHQALSGINEELFTYTEQIYKGRRIVCTYSAKRARKDAHQRQKLIEKAEQWLAKPNKYKQVKKRGAGRFIKYSEDGQEALELNQSKIEQDAKFDGFKALSTSTKLTTKEILAKYKDLFEVEHSFRALKSQIKIRPMFHWTDKRIKGHIVMCFIAFTMLNHLRKATQLQYGDIVKAIDKMQLSKIYDGKAQNCFYLRAAIDENQQIVIRKLQLNVPNDTNPQNTINQYFMK